MASTKPLYVPTDDEMLLIEASKNNKNLFTNYFIRSKYTTGTYYRPAATFPIDAPTDVIQEKMEARRKQIHDTYQTLFQTWNMLDQSPYFLKNEDGGWQRANRIEFERYSDNLTLPIYQVRQNPDDALSPIFYRHHGFLFQDNWQKELAETSQAQIVIIGGWGSGKSVAVTMLVLYYMATIPGFKAAVIGPYAIQVKKNYEDILSFIRGSIFEERFVRNVIKKPPQEITIGNSVIGENTIIFLPALDDPEKIKNLELDVAIVEQVEQFQNILGAETGMLSMMSSRVRGFDFQSGRERMGRVFWVANSSKNPDLWSLADRAETSPKVFRYFKVSTMDNKYVSENQMLTFLETFARTAEDAEVTLAGGKPKGSGAQFSQAAVARCSLSDLTELMAVGRRNKYAGYERGEAAGVGVHRWRLPYEEGATYLLVADPGWGNPPRRNAPVIIVFRVDNFPENPAEVVAFDWVFGNGQPNPWIDTFKELHDWYNITPGYSAYDATGPQSGYRYMDAKLQALASDELSMAGGIKDTLLTFLRILLNREMIVWADEILGIGYQLTEYQLPDTKIDQDIVMAMVVAAAWLQPHYKRYVDGLKSGDTRNQYPFRHGTGRTRNARNIADRYGRSQGR